jgi:hypothetical protein
VKLLEQFLAADLVFVMNVTIIIGFIVLMGLTVMLWQS